MAVPVANGCGVLADENDGFKMKCQSQTQVDAATVSASEGEFCSQSLSPATQNGDTAKSLDSMTNSSLTTAVKGASFKAAQMASLEKFNKMVAAKYPDLKPDVHIPEKFTCAVCWQIMVRPTHCIPCKHFFCEPCLRSVSSAANGRFRSLCPYCRQTIHYTMPNQDLEKEMRRGDDVTASEYVRRLEWLEQQKNIAKMPLPGFSSLRWISRIIPWSGPRTSKIIDSAERQLFNQCAFFALQPDEDHYNRTPPILTTIFDLLLVLFFYFAVSSNVFVSVDVLEGMASGVVTRPSEAAAAQRSAVGECVFMTIGSGLLYFLPFSGLDESFILLCGAVCVTFVLNGCVRFIPPQWFAMMHELGAGNIWYLNLPFAAVFLWFHLFACEYLAKLVSFITATVPSADSKAGFACILLGLTLLLHLPSMITKPAVNLVIWTIAVCSILFIHGDCTLRTSH